MRSLITLSLLCVLAMPSTAAQTLAFSAQIVQELLDAGRQEEAVGLLNRHLRRNPTHAEALFLRSTAHIMGGDLAAGRRDLSACLEANPAHRAAWLNRAALDMAESRYGDAVTAFSQAERLDPAAPDNSLNIGAALLLAGDREQASSRFRTYLSAHQNDSRAYYLVAANYAMADRPALAIPLLERSIQLDERSRLRVRTDANFSVLVQDPEFQQLLLVDSYQPPPGASTAARSFELPYSGRDSLVLDAVLLTLQKAGAPIESGVEVTPSWALVWSDMRIKVFAGPGGRTTVVSLSSSPGELSPAAWEQQTADFFRRVTLELGSRRPRANR